MRFFFVLVSVLALAGNVRAAETPSGPIVLFDFREANESFNLLTDKAGPRFSKARLAAAKAGLPVPKFVDFDGGRGVAFDPANRPLAGLLSDEEFDTGFPKGMTIRARVSLSEGGKVHDNLTIVSRDNVRDAPRGWALMLTRYTRTSAIPIFQVTRTRTDRTDHVVRGGRIRSDGKAHEILAVFRPRKALELYIDGKLAARTETSVAEIARSDAPVTIGARYYGGSPINHFHGIIALVEIYASAVRAPGKPEVAGTGKPKTKTPFAPNWSNDGAWRRDNGMRGELILNGTWLWQFKGDAARPVPGKWYFRNQPSYKIDAFPIWDSRKKFLRRIGGKKLSGTEPAFLKRSFTVPNNWSDRDVYLIFYNVLNDARVFLDDEELGIFWQNVPQAVKIDVAAGSTHELLVVGGPIVDDVYLKSYPRGPQVDESFIRTFRRAKKVTVRLSGSNAAPGVKVRLVVSEYKKPDAVVLTGKPVGITVQSGGKWSASLERPWKNPRTWNPDTPNLYQYTVEVLDQNGRVVDRTLPRRFGFAEYRINGGHLMLNDTRLAIRGANTNPFRPDASKLDRMGNEKYLRDFIRYHKKLGINASNLWAGSLRSGDMVYRIADEEGYLLIPFVPRWPIPDQFMENKTLARYAREHVTQVIKRNRESPCIALYLQGGGSHPWDYYPSKLDGSYDPRKVWPAFDQFYRRTQPLRDLVTRTDPSRPLTFHSGGNAGPIHTSMAYINFDSDLQVHENWPLAWHEKQHKPLLPTEFSFPFYSDWYTRPHRSLYPQAGSVPLAVELAAMYLGEEPYRTEPDDIIDSWYKRTWTPHAVPGPNHLIVSDLFMKNVFRAWRGYGIDMTVHGYVDRTRAGKTPFMRPGFSIDPRKPGGTAHDIRWWSYGPETPLNKTGRIMQAALSPLLGYIGGPDGRFTLKDHSFVAGEKIRKVVVLVNDRFRHVTVTGTWSLTGPMGLVASGSFRRGLPAGTLDNRNTEISFVAPVVTERTELTLSIEGKADSGEVFTDRFAFQVFPKTAKKPKRGPGMPWIIDPAGETHKMLKAAGVETRPFPAGKLPGAGLLIIGRRALTDKKTIERLKGARFDEAVEAGLDAIVFEQPVENVLGLKTEQLRTRRAFIVARGHPVFKGLTDADFKYLRGDSDLEEAFPDPGPPPARNPIRFPEWGNDNVVATWTLVRPQLGSARALLACGFDLAETPLLEVARGRGRMLFCQVDVTNRYGTDPVSTRLVDNILAYVATWPGHPLKEGDLKELWKTPSVKLGEIEAVRFRKPSGKKGWGITAGDLFFRRKVKLRTTGDGGLFGYTRASLPGHTLDLERLNTGWQRSKAMRAVAAARMNAGYTSKAGPALAIQGDRFALYPVEWLEGFVHPYDYWRW